MATTYFTLKDECYGQLWKGFQFSLYYGSVYRVDKIPNTTPPRARIVSMDESTKPQLVLGEFIDRLGEDGKIVACTEQGARLRKWTYLYPRETAQPLPLGKPDNPINAAPVGKVMVVPHALVPLPETPEQAKTEA